MKTKQILLAMEVYCTYLNNCSNRVGAEYKEMNLDSSTRKGCALCLA